MLTARRTVRALEILKTPRTGGKRQGYHRILMETFSSPTMTLIMTATHEASRERMSFCLHPISIGAIILFHPLSWDFREAKVNTLGAG